MDPMISESEKLVREKMLGEGLSQEFVSDFISKIQEVRNGETGIVKWEEVGDLDSNKDEISLEKIESEYPGDPKFLKELVVIKFPPGRYPFVLCRPMYGAFRAEILDRDQGWNELLRSGLQTSRVHPTKIQFRSSTHSDG